MRNSCFILLFFLFHLSQAQVVTSVSFEGLRKTKESYVRQFVNVKAGDALDSAKLEQDRSRLANLEMFGHAHLKVFKNNDGYDVIFWCDELFTLLPIFSFGGIEENFWVQAGVSEVNLSGMGHKFTTYYQYYDLSSYAMHLTLERINGSDWGANFNFIKWSTLEPLFFSDARVEYEYDNWTVGGTAIRYFQFRDKLEFGGAFFTEDYQKETSGFFEDAPDQVSKAKILGKALLTIDRINYYFFYQNGMKNQLNLQTVQSLNNDPAFYILFNDLSYFKRIGKRGNAGIRYRMGLSSNQESPFAPFVLDSYLNIRGVGNRVDRGTGALILNAEYRHSFLDKDVIAIQGVIFSDSGSWRNPGGNFSDFAEPDNFVLFAGGGIRMIHKKIYNAILRVDYGFNLREPGLNGFVLGIGQYF